jgi:hypothetical protein
MRRRNIENIGRTLSRSLGAPILLFLLWGCAGPLTMDNINLVERGMSPERLSAMVGRNPTKVVNFIDPHDGLEYYVQIFPMQTGTTSQYVYNQYGGFTVILPVSEDFAFLFRDESLVYWGFPHEYPRAEDERIRRLAPMIWGRWRGEDK